MQTPESDLHAPGMSRRTFLKLLAIGTAGTAGTLAAVSKLAEFLPIDEGDLPKIYDQAIKLYDGSNTASELAQHIHDFVAVLDPEQPLRIPPQSTVKFLAIYGSQEKNASHIQELDMEIFSNATSSAVWDGGPRLITDPLKNLNAMNTQREDIHASINMDFPFYGVPRKALFPLISQNHLPILYQKTLQIILDISPSNGIRKTMADIIYFFDTVKTTFNQSPLIFGQINAVEAGQIQQQTFARVDDRIVDIDPQEFQTLNALLK